MLKLGALFGSPSNIVQFCWTNFICAWLLWMYTKTEINNTSACLHCSYYTWKLRNHTNMYLKTMEKHVHCNCLLNVISNFIICSKCAFTNQNQSQTLILWVTQWVHSVCVVQVGKRDFILLQLASTDLINEKARKANILFPTIKRNSVFNFNQITAKLDFTILESMFRMVNNYYFQMKICIDEKLEWDNKNDRIIFKYIKLTLKKNW